ncbi:MULTISPECIES: hypothetical protein [Streptomyces]|uniref:Resolvase HTH domain-containing protein n=1 Tax=Streptomyces muensis TaxID=1077944 RepID=A0A9X1TH61_STRM4|nr:MULTISPECIES: hypothetical protein [Streptomyces]MCF1592421.1 hypothetical protein [Streptomyces muensis]QKV98191.1 hypothetical protein HUT19_41455 [Streptomyces sp. NA02950]
MTTALLPLRPAPADDEPRTAAPAVPVRRGRGRPPALTNPEQIEQLLTDISRGATVAEAAASAGLSRTPVYNLRQHDSVFAAALTLAQKAGKQARRAAGPELQVDQHGTESSYTKRRCPCEPCRAAGTQARNRRRAATGDTTNAPAAAAA